MTEQNLLQLKKDVEAAKTKTTELTGQKNALMKQLKDDWKCSDLDSAQKKLTKMDEELETLESQIKKGIGELQTKYNIQ
jgi:predicted nuclease with TOPRIM domain